MEIKSVKPYNIEKVFNPKEKQNIKIEEQKTPYASSLDAMSLAAQGSIKSRFHNLQVIRAPQILANSEKYLTDAKNKQKEAEEMLQYAQSRLKQLKIMPGNEPELLTERRANGNTITILYKRGRQNIIINSIKVTKKDSGTEYVFNPSDNKVSQVSIWTKKQDDETEKLYQYLNEPTILYIKKTAKGMEQEHTYYFNKDSLSAFENQIKTKKSTFNESFKLNDGSILDYSVSSKKIN